MQLFQVLQYSCSSVEHQWPTFQKETKQSNWVDMEKQREFFTHISRQLGIKTFEDWYKVKVS